MITNISDLFEEEMPLLRGCKAYTVCGLTLIELISHLQKKITINGVGCFFNFPCFLHRSSAGRVPFWSASLFELNGAYLRVAGVACKERLLGLAVCEGGKHL
jgi:hypothetical protein